MTARTAIPAAMIAWTVCATGSALAQTGTSLYTVCSSANDQPAVYLSDVFETTGPLANQGRTKAFTDFLAQKYAYKGTVVCSNMPLANAQEFVQNRLYALLGENKQVFQTGWTFGGAPAAPMAGAVPNAPSSVAAPAQPGNVPPPYGRPYGAPGNPYRDGTPPPPPTPYGTGPYGAYPYGANPYGPNPYGVAPCTGYGCVPGR
ncbi:MAG TPA: hypothetical protein VNH44_14620 [Micropepsaceae bacterium]|nr:hypothetical protein [Micropepsaceae bacterium]